MNDKSRITAQLLDAGMVPVFYHSDLEVCKRTLAACYAGGVRVFEFVHRGDEALANFKALKAQRDAKYTDLILGIGSIIDAQTARSYIEIGADFIVAPIVHEATARECRDAEVNWVPGCGTLTEIVRGTELGATLVKVFPGAVLGPQFVKAVLGPVPHLKLMPTGGVEPTAESIKTWFDAGVTAVGMGSQLIRNDGDYVALEKAVRDTFRFIAEYR